MLFDQGAYFVYLIQHARCCFTVDRRLNLFRKLFVKQNLNATGWILITIFVNRFFDFNRRLSTLSKSKARSSGKLSIWCWTPEHNHYRVFFLIFFCLNLLKLKYPRACTFWQCVARRLHFLTLKNCFRSAYRPFAWHLTKRKMANRA